MALHSYFDTMQPLPEFRWIVHTLATPTKISYDCIRLSIPNEKLIDFDNTLRWNLNMILAKQ